VTALGSALAEETEVRTVVNVFFSLQIVIFAAFQKFRRRSSGRLTEKKP
jgi:hypothetical protein